MFEATVIKTHAKRVQESQFNSRARHNSFVRAARVLLLAIVDLNVAQKNNEEFNRSRRQQTTRLKVSKTALLQE